MKFFAETYNSPKPNQGRFDNVFVEDTCIIHKRNEKYLNVEFEMYYNNSGKRVVLDKISMVFFGASGDLNSSNKTTLVKVNNPDHNPEDESSDEFLIKPFFTENDDLNLDPDEFFEIVDYGYPTYEKVLQMFQGGDFENPEIQISDPFAIEFIMNKLLINGEYIKQQFSNFNR